MLAEKNCIDSFGRSLKKNLAFLKVSFIGSTYLLLFQNLFVSLKLAIDSEKS